jgi:uncharacterized damage-inducible protein DinB
LLESILIDSFTRIREQVVELTDGLSDELAAYRPDEGSNSLAWLIWHLTRVQDDHVAGLARVEQAWPAWRDRFDLPFDEWATGYGHTSVDVAAVRVSSELLAGYHAAVHELTLAYLDGITDDELARVVDTRWDPPVTAAVRLVSVLGDALQHLGQAGYVQGLAERHNQAWRDSAAADR